MMPPYDPDILNDTFFFHSWSMSDRIAFLSHEVVQKVPKGQRIITQGAYDRNMFLLLSGTARVYKSSDPELTLAWLKNGQFFGEIAFFQEITRTANIDAQTRCTMVVITPEIFESLESPLQAKFYHGVILSLIERVHPLNKAIKMLHTMLYKGAAPSYFEDELQKITGLNAQGTFQ
ncbi:Crp/Fnr family transcriptional regulator [Magnetococcus sp. PR-3]|uniref:Crp/Fnr family transcriptional regulator n=1 Tax=Magnetococcus sp. PR-3 TaxID=3120355 RepID=UPI002FCE217B